MLLIRQWFTCILFSTIIMSVCHPARGMERIVECFQDYALERAISWIYTVGTKGSKSETIQEAPPPQISNSDLPSSDSDISTFLWQNVEKKRREVIEQKGVPLELVDQSGNFTMETFFRASCNYARKICHMDGDRTESTLCQTFKARDNDNNKFYFYISMNDYMRLSNLYTYINEHFNLSDARELLSSVPLLVWQGRYDFSNPYPIIDNINISTTRVCQGFREKLMYLDMKSDDSDKKIVESLAPEEGYQIPVLKIKLFKPKDKLEYIDGYIRFNVDKLSPSLDFIISDLPLIPQGKDEAAKHLVAVAKDLKKSINETMQKAHLLRYILTYEKKPEGPLVEILRPFLKGCKVTVAPYQQVGSQYFQLEYLLSKQANELRENCVKVNSWVVSINAVFQKNQVDIEKYPNLLSDLKKHETPSIIPRMKEDCEEVGRILDDYVMRLSRITSRLSPSFFQLPQRVSEDSADEKEKEVGPKPRKPTLPHGVKIISTVTSPTSPQEIVYYKDRDGLLKSKIINLSGEYSFSPGEKW